MFNRKKKKVIEFENDNDRFNYDSESFDKNKNRAQKIGNSEMEINDKLLYLDKNKSFDYRISEMILKCGINLLNIFQQIDEDDFGEPGVDGYGNTFLDFLDNDNNFAFKEIEAIINSHSINKLGGLDLEIYKKYKFVIYVRNSLLDLYSVLNYEIEEIDIEKLKKDLYTFVATCSVYAISNSLKEAYINDQFDMIKELFIEYFEDYNYKDERKNAMNFALRLY